jgi:hypothetical protein
MRISIFVLAAATAALLGGCSLSSPGVTNAAASSRERVPTPQYYPPEQLSPANVLRMQLEGKFPTPQLHSAFVASYERSLQGSEDQSRAAWR